MEAAAAPGLSGNKLSRHVKEVIVHMHEHCELSAPKIAPLIPSPRSLEAGASVAVLVVFKVLAHKATYGNVFEKNRKAVDRKMTEKHARMLICVITERPFLYLDEIAESLKPFLVSCTLRSCATPSLGAAAASSRHSRASASRC